MGETLWQKAYDKYIQDNSYQGKLEKENKRLKAKLDRIKQIVNSEVDPYICNNMGDVRKVQAIKKILEQE